MGRLLNQFVTILLLIVLVYLIVPGDAPGQTLTVRAAPDRIEPARRDLPYWDALLAARPCTASTLAAALEDDGARGHCAPTDQACHRTAASVILRVCDSRTDARALTFCDDPVSTDADRMACRIAALSGTTRSVADLHPLGVAVHDETRRQDHHDRIAARAAAIRAILPPRTDIRGRTDLGLPARRRLQTELAMVETLTTENCPSTIPAANIPICEDAEAAHYLDSLARAASAAFAIWDAE